LNSNHFENRKEEKEKNREEKKKGKTRKI